MLKNFINRVKGKGLVNVKFTSHCIIDDDVHRFFLGNGKYFDNFRGYTHHLHGDGTATLELPSDVANELLRK